MSEKIGLITLHDNNYGSVLQCHATKSFIQEYGYVCEVLYEKNDRVQNLLNFAKREVKDIYLEARYKNYKQNKKKMKESSKLAIFKLSDEAKRKLRLFVLSVLKPRGVSFKLISTPEYQNQYKYFIAGSDQIWNGGRIISNFSFLKFAENSKKIALSPSFGVAELLEFNKNTFKKNISSFQHMSVREFSGVDIIKNLTGETVPRLADPVVLLTPNQWEDFSCEGKTFNDEYIFVHFLDDVDEWTLNEVNRIASERSYKIICFSYRQKGFSKLKDYTFYAGTPQDYVSLLRNAKIVFTDSFHTSLFSIIFNRNFYTFERNYTHQNKQSARLETLFNIYDCVDRFIQNKEQIERIRLDNQPSFDSTREFEREELISYMESFLGSKTEKSSDVLNEDIQLKSSNKCTGCMACKDICPTKAIGIRFSDLGYKLPIVNPDTCIHCNLCVKACKSDLVTKEWKIPKAYISFSKEKKTRLKAASGGTFASLASSVISKGGYVAGACLTFDDGLIQNKHIIVDSIDNLDSILNSKYVESDCSDIYKQIGTLLRKNETVLFCGTSCQVKGLYRYMNIIKADMRNLFTVDLICHGVPGIQLFRDYISWVEQQEKGRVIDFKFRRKEGKRVIYAESITLFRKGQIETIFIPLEKSWYYQLFMHYESYRDECYECEFSSMDKPADITVGDYFEAHSDYPDLFERNSILENSDYLNSLIVHNSHGEKLVSKFGDALFLYEVDPDKVQLSHPELCRPNTFTIDRFAFRDLYEKNDIDSIDKIIKRKLAVDRILNFFIKTIKNTTK